MAPPKAHAAYGAALALTCAAACAHAQTAPTATAPATATPGTAEQIVVTATRTAEPLRDVPASVSVVSSDQIADTPAQGLDDILQLVPGMTLNEIGPDVGHPTAYNESMRGLPTTETRMLVLVDGIPLNDPFFGYIQWNRIPLDNIDQVEIVRGGGSPLWGNDAMGGVVNVITRPPAGNSFALEAAGGTYGTYRTSAYGTYAVTSQLKLSLNAAFNGTDGYQTTPAKWTTYGTTTLRSPLYTPTSFYARNISLRADYDPLPDISSFAVFDYHGNDQVLTTPIGDDSQTTFSYSGGVKKTFSDGSAITANLFHNDSTFTTNNPHLLTFTTEYNSNIHQTPVSDTGGSLDWTADFSGILRSITIGMDAHRIAGTDYSDYYLPSGQLAVPTIVGGGKQLFLAGFAQARLLPVKGLDVIGSVRYQYYENTGGDDTFPPAIGAIPSSSDTSFDPRVNVRYKIKPDIAVRGAYYTSFRAPTLDELYRTYADTTAGIYEGNPYLKPETLNGGEIGFDYNRPGVLSQLTFYTATINNLITSRNLTAAQSPTSLGVTCGYDAQTYTYLTCTQNYNAARALTRGIEAEITFDLGYGFSGGLAYTYTDSHYLSDPINPAAVGERLEGVPRHNFTGSLVYAAPSGWRIATDMRYVSDSFGDPIPADNLKQNAHFVMDLSGAYPITKNLQAYTQIENLFNRHYIANNFGGAPILGTPFEILGGVRIGFK
jgi:outer membrane receptor protein involved in Fe transport